MAECYINPDLRVLPADIIFEIRSVLSIEERVYKYFDVILFMANFKEKANLIWRIADLLRGHYKQADYGKVILPFTVLRRLEKLEPGY